MGTDVAVRDVPRQIVRLSNEQLKYIASTEFVPKDKRGNMPKILACVSIGRGLGIDDLFALNNIILVDGSPSYSAALKNYLARRAGHKIDVVYGDTFVKATGTRRDNGSTAEVITTVSA